MKLNCLALVALLHTTSAVADIRINEFMAANDTVLLDDDGDYSDWIELYNSGAAINLQDWYLTDNAGHLRQWSFPSVELPANGYLLIYASGKDRVSDNALHTSFKLSKGGEYLGLVRPDGLTVESAYRPDYPEQIDDVSYGFAQQTNTSSGDGYLLTPTPGEENSGFMPASLKLLPESEVFTDTLRVEIESDGVLAPGDVIRYTIDGTDPVSTSPLYSSPVVLSNSAILRAAVFRGDQSFTVFGGQYIEYTAELIGFDSSLPLVIIDTFKLDPDIASAPYTDAALAFLDNAGGVSTLSSESRYLGFGGISTRGASSRSFAKKSYKLELWDSNREESDTDLYGMGPEADWVLIAPGNADRSYIANPLMASLASDVGLSLLSWRFVEVYLNKNDGNVGNDDYIGIYMLVENIKLGKQRIDLAKLTEDDVTEPEITGGYIFKRDWRDEDELVFSAGSEFDSGDDRSNLVAVHRPRLADMNTAQTTWFERHIREFESSILGNQAMSQVTGYRTYIEEDSWIDVHLLQLMAKNADMLKLSNYFYKDKNMRIVNGPLWDLDRSLNSTDIRDDDPGVLFTTFRQVDPFNYSWWGKLFEVPHFAEKHRRRWHVLRQGPLADDALFNRIDALASVLLEPYVREDARWGEAFEDYGSRYGGSNNFQGEIDALKIWLTTRLDFMDALLVDPGAPDCNSTTLDYTLVINTWALLGLPCEPPEGASLATLFGDDVSGVYEFDWVVYVFNPALGENGEYETLSEDLLPEVGQGFWIIQTRDPVAFLDLPENSLPVSSGDYSSDCVSLQGQCSSVTLPARPGWVLLGNPHREAVAMEAIRVVGETGQCASGCNLSQGRATDVVPSSLFTYQREVSRNYQRLADVGVLNEWDGFWAYAGPNSSTSTHVLQVPLTR